MKKQSDIFKIESHKVRVCGSKVLQKTDFVPLSNQNEVNLSVSATLLSQTINIL